VVGISGCVWAIFHYKRKAKEFLESVKAAPLQMGKDAWGCRKDRKETAKKEKEQKPNAQKLAEEERTQKTHKEWLDTLPLTDAGGDVVENEAVMNGMLEFIKRESKPRLFRGQRRRCLRRLMIRLGYLL
jgi:hypothetical protein